MLVLAATPLAATRTNSGDNRKAGHESLQMLLIAANGVAAKSFSQGGKNSLHTKFHLIPKSPKIRIHFSSSHNLTTSFRFPATTATRPSEFRPSLLVTTFNDCSNQQHLSDPQSPHSTLATPIFNLIFTHNNHHHLSDPTISPTINARCHHLDAGSSLSPLLSAAPVIFAMDFGSSLVQLLISFLLISHRFSF